jgi:hypothetical protein
MGKLLEKYTRPEKTVEFEFPLSGDKLKFNRPSVGQIKTLQEFGGALEGDLSGDVKMAAKVIKMLCVDLKEESEANIRKDIGELEAPDRGALLPFYFELLGITKEDVWESVSRNLQKTTKN